MGNQESVCNKSFHLPCQLKTITKTLHYITLSIWSPPNKTIIRNDVTYDICLLPILGNCLWTISRRLLVSRVQCLHIVFMATMMTMTTVKSCDDNLIQDFKTLMTMKKPESKLSGTGTVPSRCCNNHHHHHHHGHHRHHNLPYKQVPVMVDRGVAW